MKSAYRILLVLCLIAFLAFAFNNWRGHNPLDTHSDPKPVTDQLMRSQDSYGDESGMNFWEVLWHRAKLEPFNLVATAIFMLAISHTMMTGFFHHKAADLEKQYKALVEQGLKPKNSHSMRASIFHLMSEVEAVFGIWAVALAVATLFYHSWGSFTFYINGLDYTEPLFKVVVMTIASTRPVLKLSELALFRVVKFFGNTLETWWLSILILTPILASFITEPAAMTIGAYLLADKFYVLEPSKRLKYVTLALLFVNVSLGGAITNFTGMAVLMVSHLWEWNLSYIFLTFGWKIILAIVLSTLTYYLLIKKDLNDLKGAYDHYLFKRHIQQRFISQKELQDSFIDLARLVDKRVKFTSELNAYGFILKENIKTLAEEKLTPKERELYDIANAIDEKFEGIQIGEMKKIMPGLLDPSLDYEIVDPDWDKREDHVPLWMMVIHVLFLIWSVAYAHQPVLLLAGFLFFLGFYEVSDFYQNKLDLKPALLVAFFLSGLLIHGTLQAWWIAPLLGSLNAFWLNVVSIFLSGFNDNASITYLGTLARDMTPQLKYALFTGALTGGGLTLIANAPNAVGRSILKVFFDDHISGLSLLYYALLPTAISAVVFWVLR